MYGHDHHMTPSPTVKPRSSNQRLDHRSNDLAFDLLKQCGRYWDRTSDLFGVNCRRWGSLRPSTHVKQYLGWGCGPLGAPRLLYFAAVPLWTAASGGLPCTVCGDQVQNLGALPDEGKRCVKTRSFGRTVVRGQWESLRGDGDGDRLGDDLLLGDRLPRVTQVVKVEADRLLGVLDALDHGFPFGDAPRQGRHRDGVTAVLGVGVEQDRVGRQPAHDSRLQQVRKLIARDLCGLKDCRERLRLEDPAGMSRDHNSRSGPLGVNQNHVRTGLTTRAPPRAVQRAEQISAGGARRSGHVGARY
jgi:hypothetical protein